MAIFIDKNTRILVQGITGREGQFHTGQCREYGSTVVAGVTPGKGGQDVNGVPVFNSVTKAVSTTGANCSLIFVPPPFAADAIMEAAEAGVPLIIT
ncbi:succinate--CoA ligase subunit alpha, partial [bacterium]|nr:succinate--CoA ligase subunit alpha [bacterium]